MIDKQSGLEIRKTKNGMRLEDGIPTPPQTRGLLELDESGKPVDFKKLVPHEIAKI